VTVLAVATVLGQEVPGDRPGDGDRPEGRRHRGCARSRGRWRRGTEAGGKLAFRHGLIRHQLYEGLAVRAPAALQAARALADAGAPKEQVAAQLALAPGQRPTGCRDGLATALAGAGLPHAAGY